MIELIQSNKAQSNSPTENAKSPKVSKLFTDGKNSFVLGNYDKAIELFLSHIESSTSSESILDTKLWLGRAYFSSESYLESKENYLDFQSNNNDHPKYADSLYELSRVFS